MSHSVRLAHISDVHLAPIVGFAPRYWNIKRCLGYINWHWARRRIHVRGIAERMAADIVAACPEHVLVTGDLANLGLPGEYEQARGWLESLGRPDTVTVIPGNHDIYTGRMHGTSCLASWGDYMTPDLRGARLSSTGEGFPFVRLVGSVALVALNSAVPTPPFVAAGRLGEAQIERLGHVLRELSSTGHTRVVLIHHPPLVGQAPRRRGLADAASLERVLAAEGAELVLHGHNHRQSLVWLSSATGDIPVVGVASGSAARAHKSEPTARYHLIEIERRETATVITCVTRGLLPSGGIGEIERTNIGAAAGHQVGGSRHEP